MLFDYTRLLLHDKIIDFLLRLLGCERREKIMKNCAGIEIFFSYLIMLTL